MAIYGEPKDGDFVRYIEQLNRQAGGTPGQVMPRKRSGILTKKPDNADNDFETNESVNTYGAPIDQPTATYSPDMSPGSTENTPQKPATLAARSGQRHLALALSIAAFIALWNGLIKLADLAESENYDIDNIIPIVFLMICAWMLFKGAQNIRRKQKQPLAKNAPLNIVKMGRNPKD